MKSPMSVIAYDIDAPPPLSISSHSNCGKRQDCQPNEAAISSESVIEAPNQGVAW